MNKTEPKTLSGFMELYPKEQIIFDKMKNTIIDTYKKYGFYPLDTPIIEYSEVLLAKAGGETEKQIYRFEKGENDLSLRFDLTVPLAKYVAKKSNELIFPFKRYQVGKVFRGERPQKGRFREFYQCDIDIIGDEVLSLKYDSEIISIISDIFDNLNIGLYKVKINNRKVLAGFFEYLDLKDKITDILRLVDKLEKIGSESLIKEFVDLGIEEEKIMKIIDFITVKGTPEEVIQYLKNNEANNNETFNLGVMELEQVINDLKIRKVNEDKYGIDLTIARGLDYYTGTVYETILTEFPSIGSVCSGGRYENLAEYYTDRKLPGVGVSIGLTRLFYQLMECGILKISDVSSSDIMILPMCDNYEFVYEVGNILKNNNLKIDICYTDKGFKQKLNYANRMNNKYVIIIGEDEVNRREVSLKNMYDGTQQTLSIEELKNINNYIEL